MVSAKTVDLHVPATNMQPETRQERLRLAVRAAGGNQVVSEKSGVGLSTLGNYLAGGEQKLSNTIALADACGVTVEWLATGRGPMKPGEAAAPPAPPPKEPEKSGPLHLPAFGSMDIDLLAECIGAIWKHVYGPELRPDWRPIVQATLVLYDQTRAIRANRDEQK